MLLVSMNMERCDIRSCSLMLVDNKEREEHPVYGDVCPVCLCGEEADGWLRLTCGHPCHSTCVRESMRHGHTRCSICQHPIPTDDPDVLRLLNHRCTIKTAAVGLILLETLLIFLDVRFSREIDDSDTAGPSFIVFWVVSMMLSMVLVTKLLLIRRALQRLAQRA